MQDDLVAPRVLDARKHKQRERNVFNFFAMFCRVTIERTHAVEFRKEIVQSALKQLRTLPQLDKVDQCLTLNGNADKSLRAKFAAVKELFGLGSNHEPTADFETKMKTLVPSMFLDLEAGFGVANLSDLVLASIADFSK